MNMKVKIFIVITLLLIASILIVIDRFHGKVNLNEMVSFDSSLKDFTIKMNEPAKEQVDKIIQKIEGTDTKGENDLQKNNYIPSEREDEETTEEYSKFQKVEKYVVQNGDTFYSLSKRFYGTSKYANKLFEYNRDLVKKPENLKIGMELKIPEKSVLEKKEKKIAHK